MNVLVLALGAVLSQDAAVLLAKSHDAAFLLPLASVQRNEQTTLATLISIYAVAETEESWEEVRRDDLVEIDCQSRQWRVLETRRTSRDGRMTEVREASPAFEVIPEDFPPAKILQTMICDRADAPTTTILDWERQLPAIRAGLR